MTITLTREEAQQVLNALENFCEYGAILKPLEVRDLLRAKLSEPEPEPVAVCILKTLVGIDKNGIEEWKEELLYTAPPKREWINLSAADIKLMRRASTNDRQFAEMIQAKLRDKNS